MGLQKRSGIGYHHLALRPMGAPGPTPRIVVTIHCQSKLDIRRETSTKSQTAGCSGLSFLGADCRIPSDL